MVRMNECSSHFKINPFFIGNEHYSLTVRAMLQRSKTYWTDARQRDKADEQY